MKKKAWIVVIGCLLVGLVGCGKGNSQDQKEYEEIANYYQNELSSPNNDHDIKLNIYRSNEDELQYFIERYHIRHGDIDYYLWDREKKEERGLDPLTQLTKDLKYKYMEQGEKVFETTIDYDNKQETPD